MKDKPKKVVRIFRLPEKKVRRRRLVRLEPLALALLQEAKTKGAELEIPYVSRRRWMRDLRDVLGLYRWPQDVLRHTCASYMLALKKDAGKVALTLGNSAKILLTHYADLVEDEMVQRFWKL